MESMDFSAAKYAMYFQNHQQHTGEKYVKQDLLFMGTQFILWFVCALRVCFVCVHVFKHYLVSVYVCRHSSVMLWSVIW